MRVLRVSRSNEAVAAAGCLFFFPSPCGGGDYELTKIGEGKPAYKKVLCQGFCIRMFFSSHGTGSPGMRRIRIM